MLNDSLQLDRAFSALADPVRRGMIAQLTQGPATVSELAAPLTMSLAGVLQHLKALEASGLVASRKRGRVRTVSLDRDALAATEGWLTLRREEWEGRLTRFENYLSTLQTNGEDDGG